jgi:hypothetical protein
METTLTAGPDDQSTPANAPAQQQTCPACNGTRQVQVQIFNTPASTWVTITQACPDCP